MNKTKNFFEKYKAYGWASVVLSFLPLIPQLKLENTVFQDALVAISASLFTSWVMLMTFNREFMEILCEQILPFREQIKENGLIGIVHTNKMKDLNIDLITTKLLIISMNDGKNFLSNNSTELSERYKDKSKKTIIILFNPDSVHEAVLCQQNGKDCGVYQMKIKDVIKDLKKKIEDGADIEIYLTESMSRTHTILTDDYAVSGTYRNSQGKDNVPPTYIYNNKGCEYSFIKQDIEKLRSSAQLYR